MNLRLQNKTTECGNDGVLDRLAGWMSKGLTSAVSSNSLLVEIKSNTVTLDLDSLLKNKSVTQQARSIK